MTKRWVLKDAADTVIVQELAAGLNINPVWQQFIVHRSSKILRKPNTSFRPSHLHLHDPFLMQDMEKAIDRIEQAIANNEKVLVYGDYDVDGTTAVALVYSFFEKAHKNIEYYIPDRYKEGYGISTAVLIMLLPMASAYHRFRLRYKIS
jgi:single-stranded-DNA-specific exonuclease